MSQSKTYRTLSEDKDFFPSPPMNNNLALHLHPQNNNKELIENLQNSPFTLHSRSVSFSSNTSKSPCVDIKVNYCFSDLKKNQPYYFIQLDENQNSLDENSPSSLFIKKPSKASPKSLFLSSWTLYVLSSHLAISINKQFECDYLSQSHLSLSKVYITIKSFHSLLTSITVEFDDFLKSLLNSFQKTIPCTGGSSQSSYSSSFPTLNLFDCIEKHFPFALNLLSLMEFFLTNSENNCLLNSFSEAGLLSSMCTSIPSTYFSSLSSGIFALDGLNYLYGFFL
jgi:hypothetical protein